MKAQQYQIATDGQSLQIHCLRLWTAFAIWTILITGLCSAVQLCHGGKSFSGSFLPHHSTPMGNINKLQTADNYAPSRHESITLKGTRYDTEDVHSFSSAADGAGGPASTSAVHVDSAKSDKARSLRLRATWNDYVAKHKAAVADPQDNKFLLYKPVHYRGHGNKIPAVVTSLMLAFLLNRTLIVDYADCATGVDCGNKWSQYFQQPVEMDYSNLVQSNKAFNESVRGLEWVNGGPNYVNYLVDPQKDLAPLEPFQWVWADGESDWTAHLWISSPLHSQKLRQLFTPGDVFGDVAQYLFKPSDEVHRRVSAFKNQFRPLTIGVQIRKVKQNWEGGVALRNFIDLAKVLQLREGFSDNDTTIYLATDNLEFRNVLEKAFENSTIKLLMQPADAVFNAEGREGLNRASVEGLQVALSEMFLLSRTHHLIMTRSSSFGGTSGALGRLLPWVVTKEGYYRSAISDPCCYHGKWALEHFGADYSPELFVHAQCHV